MARGVKREYPLRSVLRIAVNEYELKAIQTEAEAQGKPVSMVGREMLHRGSLQSLVEKNFPDHAPKIAREDAEVGA